MVSNTKNSLRDNTAVHINRAFNTVTRISDSERRVNNSPTATRTMSRRVRQIDKRASESEIKQHPNERENCDATETAYQHQRKNGVENRGAGNPFYSALVDGDVQAVVVKFPEEIGENAEDNGCAAEFNKAEKP